MELGPAMTRWTRSELNGAYSYRVRQSEITIAGLIVSHYQVTVDQNGVTVAAEEAQAGPYVGPETIADWFRHIQQLLTNRAYGIATHFDAEHGFPTLVDSQTCATDAGLTLEILSLSGL